MNQDITYTIFEERLDFALDMIKKKVDKHQLKVSNFEILEIATRIAQSLFIQKETARRVSSYKQ